MSVALSIIVPAYNVDKYLVACIKSIMASTFQDFEVLLVDDGSTDGTCALCDNLATMYPNLRVFHTENRGLSMARNHGLENATGTYIGFVDSDDFIVPQMFEQLVSNMLPDVQMACCRYLHCARDATKPIILSGNSKLCTGEEIWNQLLCNGYNVNVWSKLFRRDLLNENNIRFKPGHLMEDLYFTIDYMRVCQKAIFLNDRLYYYIDTPNSIMNRFENGESISEKYMAYPRGYAYASRVVIYSKTAARLRAMASMAYQRVMRRLFPLDADLIKEAQEYIRKNNHFLLRYKWGIKLFFSGLIFSISFPLWATIFRKNKLR